MEKFVKVKVEKGRKFRGEAYDVGCKVNTNTYQLPGWRRGGWIQSTSLKLWSPTKGWVWANPSYVEEIECDAATMKADHDAFAEFVINDTMTYCRSKSEGKPESEVVSFARACIRKHHPTLLALFDSKFDTAEDPAVVTQNTLEWAFKLGYSDKKSVKIAYRACLKKGLMDSPAWEAAWTIWLDLKGLNKLADKYVELGKNKTPID